MNNLNKVTMPKLFINNCFICISIFFIYSCTESFDPPEVVAKNYYLNLLNGNAEEAYLYLSEEDKVDLNIDDLKEYVFFDAGIGEDTSINELYNSYSDAWSDITNDLTSVEVVKTLTNNDEAIVELAVEVTDFEEMFENILADAITDMFTSDILLQQSADDEDLIDDTFSDLDISKLSKKELKNVKINLKKSETGWSVFLNLAKLKSDREEFLLKQKKQEEIEAARLAKEQEEEATRLAKEQEEKERIAREMEEEFEREREAIRIEAEEKRRDSTLSVILSRDNFTDDPSTISMIFAQGDDEGSYRPKSIAIARYINSGFAVLLLNQSFSVDDYVDVRFRFNENNFFESNFTRTDDLIFNQQKSFIYKVLREMKDTNKLLIGVDGESSFETAEYYYVNQKVRDFICLLEKYDPNTLYELNGSETILLRIVKEEYSYKKEDCS